MKKVIMFSMAIIFVTLILTSCETKSPELNLSKTETVSGALNSYVKVIDKSPYKIEFNKTSDEVKPYIIVTLESIKACIKPNGEMNSLWSTVNILDENNAPVLSGRFVCTDWNELENFIATGTGQKSFKYIFNGYCSSEKKFYNENDLSKAKQISLATNWQHLTGR